jgi:hypothetical protein
VPADSAASASGDPSQATPISWAAAAGRLAKPAGTIVTGHGAPLSRRSAVVPRIARPTAPWCVEPITMSAAPAPSATSCSAWARESAATARVSISATPVRWSTATASLRSASSRSRLIQSFGLESAE